MTLKEELVRRAAALVPVLRESAATPPLRHPHDGKAAGTPGTVPVDSAAGSKPACRDSDGGSGLRYCCCSRCC